MTNLIIDQNVLQSLRGVQSAYSVRVIVIMYETVVIVVVLYHLGKILQLPPYCVAGIVKLCRC
jgi:hypothetical protein